MFLMKPLLGYGSVGKFRRRLFWYAVIVNWFGNLAEEPNYTCAQGGDVVLESCTLEISVQ